MAAPEFTLFVKPYLEGWDNGEEGNTPITAEILNDNYDAFLLALNEWATSIGLLVDGIPTKTSDLNNDSNFVADASYVHTDNNYTTTEKNKLSGIEANANNYSLPTASTSTLGGVKIDGVTITIANGVISAVGGGGTDVEGNPSGTPTAVLSSIRIGNDIFSIPGGGSGGSSVSYSQILATGTKIGTITIDGVPTDIYAPTAPTKTSDLNNDSNFVSDASYVHTDNNYTTSEKNKLADLNQVEANPSSGTSAGDLTSISVGGTKYNIPSGGGGGTTVIANPSGSATDELEKIQIGNTIYSVSSGGGGGTGSGKTLVKKIKTYTGDGQIPLVVTFDEKPLLVYSIYGPGLNESNTVRMYPFVYGETKASGRYINNDSSSGNIGYTIAYSNNDLTMSVTSNPGDAGACLNNNGSSFTITYLVEENTSGGHTILNDGGTALAQEDDLQFKGAYVHDDSTNGKTVVEVTREMTSAEYLLLTEPEKKGVIVITDDEPESGFVKTTLYELSGNNPESVISLSESIENFDLIEVVALYGYSDNEDYKQNAIFNSQELCDSINTQRPKNWFVGNDSVYVWFYVTDVDELTIHTVSGMSGNGIWYVYGYKFNGGSGGGSSSGFTDYEGTLTAGQTSLTITGLEIDNTKLFDYYTDILGVNPTNIVVTNGHVTLTFPAQQTDMSVIVSVRSKTHIDKPFDIDLSDFITDKIWKYYDSANWSDATSDGSKITIAGGENKSDWTTATWVCIDLTQYPVPNNLSKLKIHLPSIETLGYSGVCVVTDSDKFGPGSNGGSDTMIRKSRLEISSGIYVLGDPSLGINETDYTLEIPCTKNDLSRYLYIGAADGVNPSDSNTYSNSLNGSFDVKIDGVWYE